VQLIADECRKVENPSARRIRTARRLRLTRTPAQLRAGAPEAVVFTEMTPLRGWLSAWLHDVTGDPAQASTTLLCAGAALANAIEHGSDHDPGGHPHD
jgi:hypothetical protein